jgi:hypothetical protein
MVAYRLKVGGFVEFEYHVGSYRGFQRVEKRANCTYDHVLVDWLVLIPDFREAVDSVLDIIGTTMTWVFKN